MAKRKIYRFRAGRLSIWYTDVIINHIAKHNVRISEVKTALQESKALFIRLKRKDWIAIVKHPYSGRYLTIILEKTGKNEYRIKTARDSTTSEKRLLKKYAKL